MEKSNKTRMTKFERRLSDEDEETSIKIWALRLVKNRKRKKKKPSVTLGCESGK